MSASFMGHVDIVKTLIEAKAQVDIQDEVWLLLQPENTATHHYTQCNCYYITQYGSTVYVGIGMVYPRPIENHITQYGSTVYIGIAMVYPH